MKMTRLSILSTLASGILCASNALAAPVLSAVAVGPQLPSPINPGQSASYTVTVSRVGNGNIDVYLTIAGLPAGATASFSPSPVHFTGPLPLSETSTLTISTSDYTPLGIYHFTVTGDDSSIQNVKIAASGLTTRLGPASLQILPDYNPQIPRTEVP